MLRRLARADRLDLCLGGQLCNEVAQLRLIAIKARNHSLEHFLSVEFVNIEWTAGMFRCRDERPQSCRLCKLKLYLLVTC